MDTKGETSELQQLVSSDAENEDSIVQDDNPSEEKLVSPVRSNKISSSGNTSHSSVNRSFHKGSAAVNVGNSRIQYVNEKKNNKDTNKTATARPRNIHKDPSTTVKHHSFLSQVPDVRHMERALLGLLDDFHSGKLRAFGSGCTMEQMTNIREQQEKLARLHFDLGAAAVPSLNDESLQRQKNNMSQLIRRLEQLSLSIEGLHNNTKK
ncbi:coiled-coil domain-containing protein 28A isoform X1 [Aethina tumida]|uniref:coiled-coil domain-containing protein 28A isoform X1 n=1 Tax=Aethina tumida TaxID=116153 RepID=UPI00096AE589|nr:coiled-coil domain-containing protein 28A isoform X1 [Aethina tumida]